MQKTTGWLSVDRLLRKNEQLKQEVVKMNHDFKKARSHAKMGKVATGFKVVK